MRNFDDEWIRIWIKGGDLMTLPEGIYHRFSCDTDNYIHAMRLFKGVPVWTPLNRPQEDHESRKYSMQTKYVTFAEPAPGDKLENEILYNLATETLTLRVHVRWWDSGGNRVAGMPLVPPDGHEDDTYTLGSDAWYPQGEVPAESMQQVAAQFPYVMAKQYQ